MNAAIGFLCGELRRLPKRLLRLLPLLLMLAAGAGAAFRTVSAEAARQDSPLRLALSVDDDSFLGKTAVAAISGNPEIAALFAVDSCTETEALDGLKSGKYAAAMLFADDFLSGILGGDTGAVRIVLSDALLPSGAIVSHAADTGEMLMRVAESAVNAAWVPLADSMPQEDAARAFERLELACAAELLTLPTAAFSGETLPYSENGLSLAAHYGVCFTVLILFLSETVFAADVRKTCTYAVFCRVRSLGVGKTAFLCGKCAVPLLFRALLLSGLVFGAYRAGICTPTVGAALSALVGLLLLNLFLCALTVTAAETPLGAALPCALGGICLFLCGGLLPLHLLPRDVAALGAYTPFGAACELFAPLLGGTVSLRAYAVAAAFAGLAVVLAVRRLDRLVQNGGLTV